MQATLIQYIQRPTEPHEQLLTQLFAVNTPLLIMDIGACEGDSTARYAQQFPQAQLYSFEPLPHNLAKIDEVLAFFSLQSQVKVVPLALSNENGTAKFYVSSGNPQQQQQSSDWNFGNKSSSLLEPDQIKKNFEWMQFNQEVVVETATLQSFCTHNHLTAIDFIHMDVQGAELMVLQGAKTMMPMIKAIWLETANVTYYKNQALQNDITTFMKAQGFVKILDTMYDRADGDQFWIQPVAFPPDKQLLISQLVQKHLQDEQAYYRHQKIEELKYFCYRIWSAVRRRLPFSATDNSH